jgi:hypothetical protein
MGTHSRLKTHYWWSRMGSSALRAHNAANNLFTNRKFPASLHQNFSCNYSYLLRRLRQMKEQDSWGVSAKRVTSVCVCLGTKTKFRVPFKILLVAMTSSMKLLEPLIMPQHSFSFTETDFPVGKQESLKAVATDCRGSEKF